jgi:ApaG protein
MAEQRDTSTAQKALIGYSKTTRRIRVTVYPQYLDYESCPPKREYAFSYTVTIENFREEPVKLLKRHWFVTSAGSLFAEVCGDGVVGEQPLIPPGHGYHYTSGCVIKDPVGCMRGAYTFESGEGDLFDVTVPSFDLLFPELIH